MVIYISALLISLGIVYKRKNEVKRSWVYTIVAGVPFILVSGLRYYVGTDYGIYKDIFNIVRYGGTVNEIERGYLWFNRVLTSFTSNYQVAIFIMAAMTISCYFFAIYLLSSDIMVSVCVWFFSLCFFESMNTVRQAFAVSLFLMGIYFIYKRKWWPYFCVILLASCFHMSAIILLFVYWIINWKSNIKWQLGLIVGILFLRQFLNKFILYLPLPNRYLKYFENIEVYTDFGLMDLVISILVWGTGWLFYRFVKSDEKEKYNLFINLQFMAVLISLLSGSIPMVYRVLQYFIYIPVFMLPEILHVCGSANNKRIIKISFLALYTMQWAYCTFVTGINDFIKYVSIFHNEG